MVFLLLSQEVFSQKNKVIIIDENGSDTLKCCASAQNCPCSNLSLALENIQSDTDIKLISDISLEYVTRFEDISNVTITGQDHTVQCNHQGGLVGEGIINIIIQGVIWDKCKGIKILNFTNVNVIDCTFQYSVVSPVLNLNGHGKIVISNCNFSYNNGAVYATAQCIHVHNSSFHNNGLGTTSNSDAALYVSGSNTYYTQPSYSLNVLLTGINFIENLGCSLICNGTHSPIDLSIKISMFSNNSNSAILLRYCEIVLLDNVTFYNNTVSTKNELCSWYGGAAICAFYSGVNIIGSTQFLDNKALDPCPYGGAIILNNSTINISRDQLVIFHHNTAEFGGAIFAESYSNIYVQENTTLEFTNNSATEGGALYVYNMYPYPYNLPRYEELILYYYHLLMESNHHDSNTASKSGSYAYFTAFFDSGCTPLKSIKSKDLFSSAPCRALVFDASIKVNRTGVTMKNCGPSIFFWIKDLQFSATVVDYFNNFVGPLNTHLSFFGAGHYSHFNFIIDSIHNDVILTSENNITVSDIDSSAQTISVFFYFGPQYLAQINKVILDWQGLVGNCSDIMHYNDPLGEGCTLVTCQNLNARNTELPPGFQCLQGDVVVTPGYWYSNGLQHYVTSCPAEYCDFTQWEYFIISPDQHHHCDKMFPDQDLQCNKNWMGFSCGECNHNDHSIKYGSIDCILSDKCLISSTPLSILVLFIVSFFYWCLVIAFIFFLLHFGFNVNAGHAFVLIFYYSVLEQIVSVLNQVTQLRFLALAEEIYVIGSYLQRYSSALLPFLSGIGTLKPPFMQYLKLCMGKSEMIDHIALVYIHPLIVFTIVVTIFVSSRRFVFVARFLRKYINSKSICLLVLLSYSSVSYTSLQILRPLAYFEFKDNIFGGFGGFRGFRPYWSPNIAYFEKFHLSYVILAILCEIIVGFGFPFLLLFQRYLTRHHNINFMSIRPIIDQLEACYRNECYWFSAYYLICRQVIYGVDIIGDIIFATFNMQKQQYTFAKFMVLLIVCCVIMVVHLWFQPHRIRSLNILDGAILLSLLLLLFSGLDGFSFRISFTLWILPLVIFVNYLAYSTKAQHFVIFISVCGLIGLLWTFILLSFREELHYFPLFKKRYLYVGITFILYLLVLLCFLVGYIIYVMKKLILIVRALRFRNLEHVPFLNHVQNNAEDSDDDDN